MKENKQQQGNKEDCGIAEKILNYVSGTPGLVTKPTNIGSMSILQKTDGKCISFLVNEIEEIITRNDSDGKLFLQVNFYSGKKILLTESLVGFKPAIDPGLDMAKLPSVVTTPDLMSVVEAIEDTLVRNHSNYEELDILKKVYNCVLEGGESVGFDLTSEKILLTHLFSEDSKAC